MKINLLSTHHYADGGVGEESTKHWSLKWCQSHDVNANL